MLPNFPVAFSAFSLLTCGFELVTRAFELVTCGFELVICGFDLFTKITNLKDPTKRHNNLGFIPPLSEIIKEQV